MSDTKLKRLPPLKSDEEAERFIEEADLTEYDLSQFKPMKFRRRGNADRVTFELPPELVRKLSDKARKDGMTEGDLMRKVLEDHLKDV
ncbi:CopG family antitoxin [Jiella sonneratiae]|uniref:Ribbon-helix-helix protein, CopG family n=1 Tax=Jiella sonneratiae TaxID=2816856 RepID=A0ABS3J6Z0_9HYPH|nr:CopG family antitoxin [Jiella sonneratiae]MBO0905431.1 ribbon-helix-helix protein, CopG family [Jiella sonneratiae]